MAKARRRKLDPASKIQKRRGLSLSKLVAQITEDNRYPEIATGPERGREVVEYVDPFSVAKRQVRL